MSKRGKERRRTKRFRKRLKVRYWWGDFEGMGFTSDISDSGLLLETSKPIAIGTRVHIEVSHDDESFFGDVVIVREKRYPHQARSLFKPALGARFLKVTEVMGVGVGVGEEKAKGAPPQVQEEQAPAVPEHIPLQVDLRQAETLAEVYERDVKHGGLRVVTTEIPELQSDVEVPVLLPEPHTQIVCRGLVVKLFDDPPGFSVHLEDVDAVRARLIEILRSQ